MVKYVLIGGLKEVFPLKIRQEKGDTILPTLSFLLIDWGSAKHWHWMIKECVKEKGALIKDHTVCLLKIAESAYLMGKFQQCRLY